MSLLRPYQRDAINALWDAITPDVNRVATEMATGLGKTITFAALIDEWLWKETGGQKRAAGCALVLVHTDKLVRQAVDKIKVVTKGRWSVGVVKASENEVGADIIVGSRDTLVQPGRKEQITDVGLIIVDEAHHAVARSYADILKWFGGLPSCTHPYTDMGHCFDCRDTGFTAPPVPTFGFSATLKRSDGQGLGSVWQDMPFSRSMLWGMRHGYLVDLVPYTIKIPGLDAGASDTVLDGQLAESIAPEAVVNAWLEKAWPGVTGSPSRGPAPSTLLFAPLVRSAELFAEAFNAAGVKAEVVHGGMAKAEILAVEQRLESGVTTVVCNAMIWTEGVDVPRVKCIVVARPTQSVPLFVQMVGRGLRPWLDAEAPPREDQRCVLLAVQGTTTQLATVADLSDELGDAAEGKSVLGMADEFDLGKDIPADPEQAYTGPVRVEQWDAIVQRSSKAWKYTAGGVPFLPLRKRSELYVFVVETARGQEVWARDSQFSTRSGALVSKLAVAPDLELAMALAEDEAQERGGDIGALLADKTRAWRKAVPSLEMQAQARRVGVSEVEIQRILGQRAAGKAGKLSDLIDRVTASRVLDHTVDKIRERARA